MSKTKTPEVVATDNIRRKQVLLIVIVSIVTALVIAASLIIALWENTSNSVAGPNNESLERSSAVIPNGDFEYLSEADTAYPKNAQDFSKYTYKEPSSSTSHNYGKISSSQQTVMGVVDTADWTNVSTDLTALGVSVANPNTHSGADGSNVYMIHNKQHTTASIYSNGFTIAGTTSVKITAWVKTVNVSSAGAFVMIKQQSTSALEVSSSGVQYWYAHQGVKNDGINTNGAWQQLEFFVFNRTSSSRTVYFNLGLGNVYTGETATGTVFVDDVEFETVTSHEYREVITNVVDDDYTSYVIETESTANQVSYVQNWTDGSASQNILTDMTANAYISSFTYMPAFEFVTDKQAGSGLSTSSFINTLSNDGTINGAVTAISDPIDINLPATGTQYLISLWVRVESINDSVLPVASVFLKDADSGEDLSSFSNFSTSDDLQKDTNNGWVKYNFYVKPSDSKNHKVSVEVAFGDRMGYTNPTVIPNGSVYFTDLIVEEVTQAQFASATAGTYISKVSLNGTSSSTVVSNGSFSNYISSSNSTDTLVYPSDWTPAYAGANEIYMNGQDNITVNTAYDSVNSGILFGGAQGPVSDDERKGVLQITNNVATSFGYISSSFSLSSNTVYVVSLLVKSTDGAIPSVYLLDNTDKKILTSFSVSGVLTNTVDSERYFSDPDASINQGATGNQAGWVKVHFVVATGDTAITAKLALFNGQIDATANSGTSVGTVYFDRIIATTLGTYTRDKTVDELWQKDSDDEFIKENGNYVLDSDAVSKVSDTIASGFGKIGTETIYEDFDTLLEAITGKNDVRIIDNRFSDVTEPVETDDEEEEPETPSNVDWALLISIISSATLLAALIIVIVVKFIFRRQRTA